jgi:putative ABC transport system permease protein
MKTFARLAYLQPSLSAVIVATLALGIGSATALYSVIQAVLLRPFPFRDQQQLVLLWQTDVVRNHPFVEVSYLDFRDWRTRTEPFESMAAMSSVNFATTLTGIGEPRQLQVRAVSEPFFDVLGSVPVLGRTFVPDDHRSGAGKVVVIGYSLWRELFGSDPASVGRSMVLDGDAHTVVGVMPPDFRYPEGADMWTPVEPAVPKEAIETRRLYWMVAVGRMRPGVDVETATAALNATIGALAREFGPEGANPFRAVVRPLVGEVLGTTRQALLLLLGAVGAVLFIACANVANLLLSRSVDRRREIATRLVLGASRARLARQLMGEVLPLACAGGAFGVVIAWWALESLVRIAGAELPRADEIRLDTRALGVATALSLGSGLLCALAPLMQSREVVLGSALRDDVRAGTSRLQRRMRDALVTAEIALALVLMVGAALLIASFVSLQSQDLGFKPSRVLVAEVPLSSPKYEKIEQARLFQRQLVERFRGLPGVEAASAVLLRPLWSMVGYDWHYTLEGQSKEDAEKNPLVNLESSMPGYFSTMGIRLVSGRDFTEQDDENGAGVIIVSEGFARSAWPGQEPLGRRLRMNLPDVSRFDDKWLTVVGVVADARYREIESARLDLYQPYGQFTGAMRHMVIRTAGDPRSIARAVRQVVHATDPGQPVDIRTMDEIVSVAMGRWRLNARLFGTLALLALLLAAVGTYSVMNYAVSRRTQEIGVRVALGAGRTQITRLVLVDGLRLAFRGVAVGTLVAFAATGLLQHLLIGVGPRHPGAFVGASVLLLLVALVACLLPARRASSLDPMVAMRTL